VPISTVRYWARKEILVPSISPQRQKLWSYPDLMGLRINYWLRHEKTGHDGQEVPASTMPKVKAVLEQLTDLDLALWSEDGGPGSTSSRRATC
jgi:DNA-binding transcriptional MerR regulator